MGASSSTPHGFPAGVGFTPPKLVQYLNHKPGNWNYLDTSFALVKQMVAILCALALTTRKNHSEAPFILARFPMHPENLTAACAQKATFSSSVLPRSPRSLDRPPMMMCLLHLPSLSRNSCANLEPYSTFLAGRSKPPNKGRRLTAQRPC